MRLRRLHDGRERHMRPSAVLRQPFFQLLRAGDDHRAQAPAAYRLHFRVPGGADDEHLPPVRGSGADDLVYARDEGAGGVHHLRAAALQLIDDGLRRGRGSV